MPLPKLKMHGYTAYLTNDEEGANLPFYEYKVYRDEGTIYIGRIWNDDGIIRIRTCHHPSRPAHTADDLHGLAELLTFLKYELK